MHTYACFLDVSKDVASYVGSYYYIAESDKIIYIWVNQYIATQLYIVKRKLYSRMKLTLHICRFVLRQYACALFILSRAHEICMLLTYAGLTGVT